MTYPLVSVIIPVKNEAANLARCLTSLRRTGYGELEVIVVDNGSSDGTAEVARSFNATVYVMPHLTVSGLRNHGAMHARGEILGFVDADCEVDPRWIERGLPHFADPAVACAGSTAVPPEGGTWVQRVWGAFRARKRSSNEAHWLNSMNMFVRKSAFWEVNGFNPDLVTCEDVDFCLRLRTRYVIIRNPQIRVVHYGEAATVKSFFLKELWRGQSNVKASLSHGLDLRQLPSLALPLYYLLVTVGAAAGVAHCVVAHEVWLLFVALLLLAVPALLFGTWASIASGKMLYLLHYMFLFNVYGVARMLSLVYNVKR